MKESFYSLTQTLNKNRDDSAKKIKDRWLKESTCKFLLIQQFYTFLTFFFLDLLEEYLTWLPKTAHKEIKSSWPPL